jgi:hypothetical protein
LIFILLLLLLMLMFSMLLLVVLLSEADAWWQQEDGDAPVSMASCFSTIVVGVAELDESFVWCWFWWRLRWWCVELALQTNEVTATGETKDWCVGLVELLPVELLRIRRPPPPWIWDKLRTSGGVDVAVGLPELLLDELRLLLWWWECCCWWEWWECKEIPSREWRRAALLELLEADVRITLPEPVVEETCKQNKTSAWSLAVTCNTSVKEWLAAT